MKQVPVLKDANIRYNLYARQSDRIVILVDKDGKTVADTRPFSVMESIRLGSFTWMLNKAWTDYDESEE